MAHQFHSTAEPLIEEYTIAKQLMHLTGTDLAEIARNSVLQSGFSHARKQELLGRHYYRPGVDGNNIDKSNIPDCRVHYRHATLRHEFDAIYAAATQLEHEARAQGRPVRQALTDWLAKTHAERAASWQLHALSEVRCFAFILCVVSLLNERIDLIDAIGAGATCVCYEQSARARAVDAGQGTTSVPFLVLSSHEGTQLSYSR